VGRRLRPSNHSNESKNSFGSERVIHQSQVTGGVFFSSLGHVGPRNLPQGNDELRLRKGDSIDRAVRAERMQGIGDDYTANS